MKNSIITLAMSLSIVACTTTAKQSADVVADSFDFASKQLNYAFTAIDSAKANLTPEQIEKGVFTPRSFTKDGGLSLIASRDWCSGFFPGELWYMYELSLIHI